MLVNRRELIPHSAPQKVQYVRGLDCKHYAVGICGIKTVIDNFEEANKLEVDSMEGLARVLDRAHRDAWGPVIKHTELPMPPMNYLATDGHKVYNIHAGLTQPRWAFAKEVEEE